MPRILDYFNWILSSSKKLLGMTAITREFYLIWFFFIIIFAADCVYMDFLIFLSMHFLGGGGRKKAQRKKNFYLLCGTSIHAFV